MIGTKFHYFYANLKGAILSEQLLLWKRVFDPLCQWGRILELWFKYTTPQYKSRNTNIKYNLNLDHFKSSILLLLTSVCWLTPNCIEGNFDFVKKELSRTKMLVLQPFHFHLHTNLSLRLALTLKCISVSHRLHVLSIVIAMRLWSPFK